MDLPELSRKDVEQALLELRRREKQGRRLFAFHGRYAPGTEETLTVDGGESVHVIPVRSELDLRAHMPPIGAVTPPIVFIVPWTGEVPLDLAGRFSWDGRIKRIGKESRLKRLLGATELGEGVVQSPLAEYLLQHPSEIEHARSGGLVTLDALFDRWLSARFGIDTTDGLALDLFLGWAAIDHRAAEVDALETSHPALVRAIEEHIRRSLRDAGIVVWKAWRERRGRKLLELAVLFEALAKYDSGPAFTWRGMQQNELGVTSDEVARRVALELGDAVGRALRWVESRRLGMTREVLAAAEAQITAPDVRPLLVSSTRLPIAWELRLAALGEALAAGARSPDAATLERAIEAYAQLDTHEWFQDPKHGAVVRRAESAVQLLAWLASPQPAPEPATETPQRDAEVLGRWYVEEGGFVDLARRRARGPAGDPFGDGVQAVVEAADRKRRELDRRFARSLAGWIEAGRPPQQALPIDMAVERIALRFLQGDESRRLLLILMDGMAWAQAISIIESLGSWGATPWGPIAWHASSQGRVGQSNTPVVFAQLPTVTEVSRAAFFAGKVTPAGVVQSTADDPKRWLANKAVAKIEPEGIDPRLLLRGEGHTNDGVASQEALSLIADPKRRLVAIVINAIDASLKGDTQQEHEWTAESIRSFVQLLDKARESRRAVLLAADHGHVPADLLKSKGNYTGASPRFRPWAEPGDPVDDDEVAFHGTGVWAPRGAHGVVLLADDQSRYGGGASAGEHGGASLAEVVTPCLIIAPDDGRDVYDPAQKVMPLMAPSWWHLELAQEPSSSTTEEPVTPRRPVKKTGKAPPKEQLALAPIVSTPVTPPSPTPPTSPTTAETGGSPPRRHSSTKMKAPSPLETNELLIARTPKADERKLVVKAVEYLRERNDTANLDAFCAAMGTPAWRAAGLVRTLQQALNVDGYEALTHDLKGKQIRLHRAVLEAQFGVKL